MRSCKCACSVCTDWTVGRGLTPDRPLASSAYPAQPCRRSAACDVAGMSLANNAPVTGCSRDLCWPNGLRPVSRVLLRHMAPCGRRPCRHLPSPTLLLQHAQPAAVTAPVCPASFASMSCRGENPAGHIPETRPGSQQPQPSQCALHLRPSGDPPLK